MLDGASVLITGASSGIGRALALVLAQREVSLHLLGRNAQALAETARQARSWGALAQTYSLELTDDTALLDFAESFDAPLDVLIHSAGTITLAPVEEAAIADLDAQYRVNLRAPYLLTQKLLPRLERGGGQIVFVNSGAGLSARGYWSQYAATKHALKAFADALRDELKGRGIRVISVYPGRTATPMQQTVHEQEGRDYDPARFVQPEDVATLTLAALELPATAEVTDVTLKPTF